MDSGAASQEASTAEATSDADDTSSANRTCLPSPMLRREEWGAWTLLKHCIGRDVTRISIPVLFNEPLSLLQRFSEYMEYSQLLFNAANSESPTQRMEFVAAFAVSALSSNWNRPCKPFNPLLGETFELDRTADLGYRLISEQVSHHPPISAFHAEATNSSWLYYGWVSPKLSFWGQNLEVTPKNQQTVELTRWKETYTWHIVPCKVHNVLMGKLWVENFGDMTITNHSNGYRAELKWMASTWRSPECHRVEGWIVDSSGERLSALYGKWITAMYSVSVSEWQLHRQRSRRGHRQRTTDAADVDASDVDADCSLNLPGQRRLWLRAERQPISDRFYGFTDFAFGLNSKASTESPTDSRRRRDIRALECGRLEEAESCKRSLEEAQRRRGLSAWRAAAAGNGVWFRREKCGMTGRDSWRFNGLYWGRDWSGCPDIFC